MNEVVRKEMYREQYICLEPNRNRDSSNDINSSNVIDLKALYGRLGDKADKLIQIHNKVECKDAVKEAFKIYSLMNRINAIFKYQASKNIWE